MPLDLGVYDDVVPSGIIDTRCPETADVQVISEWQAGHRHFDVGFAVEQHLEETEIRPGVDQLK